jgi:aminoglycoside phosphotransferase (APT) family kinase protein
MEGEREKLERIKDRFERDFREMPPARTLEDVPAFYECITPEWLTAVVRQRHPGVTVSEFQLGPRDSGTTNRRRLYLQYADDHLEAERPASFFCKAAQELANRITMSAGSSVGETRFYNSIRDTLPIEAPHAYFAAVDLDSYRAIIVLEDLAAEAEFCSYATPISRARAGSQIDLLANLHGAYYNGRGDWRLLAQLDTFTQRFHKLDKHHGLEGACRRGLLAAHKVMPSELIRRESEVWPKTLQAVEALARGPQTLTHGDVHLGNWYVRGNETMGLTDFQNLTTGHWSRDLAYVLATSLSIEDRRQWERELLARYLGQMQARAQSGEQLDEAWTAYRQQMLSVLAWWTVTLMPSPTMAQDMQTEATTLCFLERIGTAIADLQTLDAFN